MFPGHDRLQSGYLFRERQTGEVQPDLMVFHFVELPKYRVRRRALQTRLEKWLYVLKFGELYAADRPLPADLEHEKDLVRNWWSIAPFSSSVRNRPERSPRTGSGFSEKRPHRRGSRPAASERPPTSGGTSVDRPWAVLTREIFPRSIPWVARKVPETRSQGSENQSPMFPCILHDISFPLSDTENVYAVPGIWDCEIHEESRFQARFCRQDWI